LTEKKSIFLKKELIVLMEIGAMTRSSEMMEIIGLQEDEEAMYCTGVLGMSAPSKLL